MTDIIKNFIKKILDDDILSQSAQFAYYVLVGIFPFFILFLSILGNYSSVLINFVDGYKNLMSINVYKIIMQVLTATNVENYFIFPFSIFILLWSTSAGSLGLVKGVNKAYNTDFKMNFLYQRGISLMIVLGIILLILFTLIFIMLGRYVLEFLDDIVKIGYSLSVFFWILRIAIPGLSYFILTLFIFRFLPHLKLTFRQALPGSLLTTIATIIFTIIYSLVTSYRIEFYSSVFGNISLVFIMVIWFYFVSFFILLGIEYNSFLYMNNLNFKFQKRVKS